MAIITSIVSSDLIRVLYVIIRYNMNSLTIVCLCALLIEPSFKYV